MAPVAYVRAVWETERARLMLFLFMFINGAIVFAGGAARAGGIPAVARVCVTWFPVRGGHAVRAYDHECRSCRPARHRIYYGW